MSLLPWEHGSEFPWIDLPSGPPSVDPLTGSWTDAGSWWATARGAIVALAQELGTERRWWLPSWYCPDVPQALMKAHVQVECYPDGPGLQSSPPPAARGDVVLVSNTLGLRSAGSWVPPPGVVTVEDHSHDPWSRWAMESAATYCVASLRKTLPLPDGAVLWSPEGGALPQPGARSAETDAAVFAKLQAMLLKRIALSSGNDTEERYRTLAVHGEKALFRCGAPASVLTRTIVPLFPIIDWRATRRRNWSAAREQFAARGITTLRADMGATPFVVTIVVENGARRDRLREQLISGRVFPSVLWTLDTLPYRVPEAQLELSRRALCLHCDFRSSLDDISRLTATVATALGAP